MDFRKFQDVLEKCLRVSGGFIGTSRRFRRFQVVSASFREPPTGSRELLEDLEKRFAGVLRRFRGLHGIFGSFSGI